MREVHRCRKAKTVADKDDFMPVLKEDAPIVLATSDHCWFCGKHVDKDDTTNYRQVDSWVTGPKLDHPVLRQQTGNFAHHDCVQKVINGQAPDQEELF